MIETDLSGKKFGRLEVLCYSHRNKNHEPFWTCKCDCGNTIVIRGADIKNGHTKSCGCLQREMIKQRSTTHGMEGTRLYRIYCGMISRCYRPSQKNFPRYGGRGIKVCDEWLNGFEAFCKWAMLNGYSDNLTLDRIDNDKNYCPENCRWTTRKEQQNNKRNNRLITYNGKTKTMQQWADELGMDSRTIYNRINCLHWSIEKALSTPVKRYARSEV